MLVAMAPLFEFEFEFDLYCWVVGCAPEHGIAAKAVGVRVAIAVDQVNQEEEGVLVMLLWISVPVAQY